MSPKQCERKSKQSMRSPFSSSIKTKRRHKQQMKRPQIPRLKVLALTLRSSFYLDRLIAVSRFNVALYRAGLFMLSLAFSLGVSTVAEAADPLSEVHKHLDKSGQCNQCHGDDINVAEPSKCRDCHREIDRRIRNAQGFHGRLRGDTNCNLCHREHLGRQYQIVQLDTRTFDHNATGWPLNGKHKETGCRECHTQQRKSGRDSYLDASKECVSCHGEFHGRGVVVKLDQCQQCHNSFGWKEMNAKIRFDHQRNTRYPLTGAHKDADCVDCHTQRTERGQIKQFGPLQVSGCESCHKDPHPRGIFSGIACAECHVTQRFKDTSSFKHQQTGWPLKGAHAKQGCLECHKWAQWKPPSNACVSCHEDVHRGQFPGSSCGDCHGEYSFKRLTFNHDTQSRFPLIGKHRRVKCASCHPNGEYKPRPTECRACHEEHSPHGDQFGEAACSQCHSPKGWGETHFDHSVTQFPLEGRHEDQPCYRCHPQGTEQVGQTSTACASCHTRTIHQGQFSGTDCGECHKGSLSWAIPFFDHSRSRFELKGKHFEVPCDGCHKAGHFKPIDTACANCHQNFHAGQLDAACDTCHVTDEWSLVPFDHNTRSEYPLEGLHQRVDCKQCHLNNQYKGIDQKCATCHLDIHKGERGEGCEQCHTLVGWETNQRIDHDFGPYSLGGAHDLLSCETCHGPDRRKSLSGTGPECVTCHRDPHFGSLGPLCLDCHTQDQFLPSTFLHNQTGFRLTGAHRFVACRSCHPGRLFGGTPQDCSFCHTDSFQSTTGGTCDHPANCPTALGRCPECHTSTTFQVARPQSACGFGCSAGGVRRE